MKKDKSFYLGKIVKTQGRSGRQFVAILDTDDPGFYNDLRVIFLDINNTLVPFYTEKFIVTGNKAIIGFERDTSEGLDELITGSGIYLPLESLPRLKGNRFYFHEIRGFEIIDKVHGLIGRIEEILDLPDQPLFRVLNPDGREILIPVADDIIEKVDRRNKQIFVITPEGLIDIYL